MGWLKRRKETRKFLSAMPEAMARISADPAGTGEDVTADDPVMQRMIEEGPPKCAFERVSRDFGRCDGLYALYHMPKRTEGGYDIYAPACDRHGEIFMMQGFVRLEDNGPQEAGCP